MLTLFESYLRGYKALYHYTEFSNALSIIRSKTFKLSVSVADTHERDTAETQIRSGKFYYLSTSRSPMNDFVMENGIGVLFILNADIIEQRVKSVPVNYFAGKGVNSNEMEERLISDKPTIPANAKTIDSIHILLPNNFLRTPERTSVIRKLVIDASKMGIETFLYDDRRHFYTVNHRRALTGEDRKDFLSGNDPTGLRGRRDRRRKYPNQLGGWIELYSAKSERGLTDSGRDILDMLRQDKNAFTQYLIKYINLYAKSDQEKIEPLLAIWRKHRISTAKEYTDLLVRKWGLD